MLIGTLSPQLPSYVKPSKGLNSPKPLASNTSENSQDSKLSAESGSQNENNTSGENEKSSTQATLSEQRDLQQLKNRDREVKAHELAHIAVGGQYITSGAQFSYQKGSDGQLYAVAGEVGIDTAEISGDPRATLIKAQIIARAALAPSDPSAQDRQVAAQAAVLMQQARIDLSALLTETQATDVGRHIDEFA